MRTLRALGQPDLDFDPTQFTARADEADIHRSSRRNAR